MPLNPPPTPTHPGETSYVMNLIRNYHEEAERKGVKLVPNCGFDSIPSGEAPQPPALPGDTQADTK